MRYYDFRRHWTKRILPHLSDPKLNAILFRDFNKLTQGRWHLRFQPGDLPAKFDACCWRGEHRPPHPRYWAYVAHAACHSLVNFALKLATLAEPQRPWRILTSDRHSTVWDGHFTLFDLNYSALRVDPTECFQLAHHTELPPGHFRKVGSFTDHW